MQETQCSTAPELAEPATIKVQPTPTEVPCDVHNDHRELYMVFNNALPHKTCCKVVFKSLAHYNTQYMPVLSRHSTSRTPSSQWLHVVGHIMDLCTHQLQNTISGC